MQHCSVLCILLLITIQSVYCTLTHYTHDELYHYNGITSPLIYVGCKENIYDVSHNLKNYGPNGRYFQYAGRDASRNLAIHAFKYEGYDITGINAQQQKALDNWCVKYQKKYKLVGKFAD